MSSNNEQFSPDRVKHLEFIQAVIARMGNSSFLVKGWALTISAAFLAFAVNRTSWKVALVAIFPLAVFWFLDGYFLRLERLFRCLYDDARKKDTTVEIFSMNPRAYVNETPWPKVTFSTTLVAFYAPLVFIHLAFMAGALL